MLPLTRNTIFITLALAGMTLERPLAEPSWAARPKREPGGKKKVASRAGKTVINSRPWEMEGPPACRNGAPVYAKRPLSSKGVLPSTQNNNFWNECNTQSSLINVRLQAGTLFFLKSDGPRAGARAGRAGTGRCQLCAICDLAGTLMRRSWLRVATGADAGEHQGTPFIAVTAETIQNRAASTQNGVTQNTFGSPGRVTQNK